MLIKTPKKELDGRLSRFVSNMNKLYPEWRLVAIFDKVNIFYFTGTMQNGVVLISREEGIKYFVKRSFERAQIESELDEIYKINSFRQIKEMVEGLPNEVYTTTEVLPIAVFERFNKYFGFERVLSCDLAINLTRAIKSEYELGFMKKSGEIHRKTEEEIIPNLIRVGVSEFDLANEILYEMTKLGHHGIMRMRSFNGELYLGNVCFGESANFYNSFDGPGGVRGVCPAVPLFGDPETKIGKDRPIYIDLACGYMGYHTDKTMIYVVGRLPDKAYEFHERCVEIQNMAAEMLKPGILPGEIYSHVMKKIDEDFMVNFMGFGSNQVRFLGHGIGLHVDEYPAIAKGFNMPLEENMVIALEPKKAIEGLGMVGIENTFLVTKNGGVSLTGEKYDIVEI